MTLVELIVTLALLSLLSGLAAAMLGSLRSSAPDEWRRTLAAARERAVRTGLRVRVDAADGSAVLFLPDGRAVGGDMDAITGVPADATR